MEEPHARVVRAEPEHGVSAARDLHRVAEDGAREVVWAFAVAVIVVGAAWVWGQAWWWEGVFEGVVGAPADGGFVDREDVEVVAVLGCVSFDIHKRKKTKTISHINDERGVTYQMKRMRSLVEVINHKIDPDWLRPRRYRKLVFVPLLPG